jgi:hypothetical protein
LPEGSAGRRSLFSGNDNIPANLRIVGCGANASDFQVNGTQLTFRVRLGVVRLTGTVPDFLCSKVCRVERLDFRRDLLNRLPQIFDRSWALAVRICGKTLTLKER